MKSEKNVAFRFHLVWPDHSEQLYFTTAKDLIVLGNNDLLAVLWYISVTLFDLSHIYVDKCTIFLWFVNLRLTLVLQDPFPLYPGEILVGAEQFTSTGQYKQAIEILPAVKQNHAIQVLY